MFLVWDRTSRGVGRSVFPAAYQQTELLLTLVHSTIVLPVQLIIGGSGDLLDPLTTVRGFGLVLAVVAGFLSLVDRTAADGVQINDPPVVVSRNPARHSHGIGSGVQTAVVNPRLSERGGDQS